MLGLFAFIILMVGAINWFFIGLLQYDFVAGLFGSQASIFSRIVYVAVGVSAFIILAILIKNKGKVVFNLSKIKEKLAKRKVEKEKEKSLKEQALKPANASAMESAKDLDARQNNANGYAKRLEAASDALHNVSNNKTTNKSNEVKSSNFKSISHDQYK